MAFNTFVPGLPTPCMENCEMSDTFSSGKPVREMFTSLNPTFIQNNWGLQGYTYFFLFFVQNIHCGYSPRRF